MYTADTRHFNDADLGKCKRVEMVEVKSFMQVLGLSRKEVSIGRSAK